MTKLKELIDANTFAPVLAQMQQRAWLMHWGLYIFFNHENGRNLIIEFLFQDRYTTSASPQPLALGTVDAAKESRAPCEGPVFWMEVRLDTRRARSDCCTHAEAPSRLLM